MNLLAVSLNSKGCYFLEATTFGCKWGTSGKNWLTEKVTIIIANYKVEKSLDFLRIENYTY